MKIFIFLSAAILSLSACTHAKKKTVSQEDLEKSRIQMGFAQNFLERGEPIRALTSALEAEQYDPTNADLQNLLGLIYARQGKMTEAEGAFKKAIALAPKGAEGYLNYGALLYSQKKYPEALAQFETALKNPLYLYPERIHNNLGLAYESLKDFKRAEENYQTAIQLRSDFYPAFQNWGRMLLNQGDIERAKPLLENAVKFCMGCAESRYFLGSLLLKEQKLEAAQLEFKKTIELDPNGVYGQLSKDALKRTP